MLRERRWQVAVSGLVLAAGAYALAGWMFGLMIVAGTWVVPAWVPSAALLVVAFVVALVRRVRLSWPSRVVAVLTSAVALLSWVGDLSATYTVLPASPDGCRVVVRESSFLFAGDGEVFLTSPFGIGPGMGTYQTDDGYRPVTVGDYEFRWESGVGRLSFTGNSTDPILRSTIRTLEC
ncbi:hypothetical protein [Lentzea sp. NPDC003310]|uniref:hypothetical protein n=1 Tax=Lentzea sp. NPDC003310 TaxID=3154447 RepID=UPI0033A1CC7F